MQGQHGAGDQPLYSRVGLHQVRPGPHQVPQIITSLFLTVRVTQRIVN
jgi:hypothetical protein